MFSFLRQPFPISELSFNKAVVLSIFFGAMIAFCLIIFQPFGSYNWHGPFKNLILSGYGVVAAFSVFLSLYAFRKILPAALQESRWTVGKEIVWQLIQFVTGGFLSAVYGAAMGIMPFTFAQVSYMIMVAFLLGIVPAVLLVLIIYVYLLEKYRPLEVVARAEAATNTPHSIDETKEKQEPKIVLSAENEKDSLTIMHEELLFIEASNNYCTVYFLKDNTLKKLLLRSSLSRLESQISQPNIVRCHRSYLVNVNHVTRVSGNAQGYKLHFSSTEHTVPVARASSGLVKSLFTAS